MNDYEKVKTAIRELWISVLMDGRNEHGTHLLPMPPDGLCITEKKTEELLDSHSDDVERIFDDAERCGYTVGCCIIISCTACEDEHGYYYKLSEFDDDLTRLIYGSAEEQVAELKIIMDRIRLEE